jgi:hypothetical protein
MRISRVATGIGLSEYGSGNQNGASGADGSSKDLCFSKMLRNWMLFRCIFSDFRAAWNWAGIALAGIALARIKGAH